MSREEAIRQVLDVLIGNITPTGETHIDIERYNNMEVLDDVINHLLSELCVIVIYYDNRGEYSVARIYNQAKKRLELIVEKIKGVLEL